MALVFNMTTDAVCSYLDMCRVCTLNDGDKHNIFESSSKGMTLAKMISICSGCDITQDDGLSMQICSQCLVNLEVAYDFRALCRDSEQKLRECLKFDYYADRVQLDCDKLVKIAIECTNNANAFDVAPSDHGEFVNDSAVVPSSLTDPKNFECDVCDEIFDRSSELRRHAHSHKSDGKLFECLICCKRYETKACLLRHQIIHSDETTQSIETSEKSPSTFKCRTCDKEFAKQESLAAHMKTHANSVNDVGSVYECDLCMKRFSLRWKLTRHLRTHEKTFVCSVNKCQRRFASSSHQRDHLNKHKQLRPHVCDICNKGMLLLIRN